VEISQVAVVDDGPCLVILFPVRRIHEKSKVLWRKVASLGNSDSVLGLVLIDKTPRQEASEFFLGLVLKEKLTVLVCDPEESIFASQSRVSVPPNSWVSQIHDDDDIFGDLTLPPYVSKNNVLQPTIRLTHSKFGSVISKAKELHIPAFTLFSFIPSEIWNLFASYVRAQGEECSPSLDVALNFTCSKLFHQVQLPSFQYHYNYERWYTKKSSKIAITNYMLFDGWGIHCDFVTAEFASQIDKLLFSIWCERFEIANSSIGLSHIAFKSIFPTKKHIANIRFRVAVYHWSSVIFRILRKIDASKTRTERAKLLSLIAKAYSCNSSYELALTLSKISELSTLTRMKERFEFWASELLGSAELIK